MTHTRLLATVLAASSAVLLAASPQQQQQQQQQQPPTGGQQQPTEVRTIISSDPGVVPKLAVPELIPLSTDADVVNAAKTIGDVLWDDLNYEHEFYLIAKDSLKTVARPASVDPVALSRGRPRRASWSNCGY
jgi:hypothetical protein